MAKPVTFYGGPMDGRQVPTAMTVIDWIAFNIAHGNNNQITYNYEYNETTNRFEFVGEDSEEEDSE
jgi:hypothetical protein